MKKETQCVHTGTLADSATGGLNTPIQPSSAYEYRHREQVPYPRYFNTPNQIAVVKKLCALEKAEDGLIFSSGMAAISTAIFAFANAGDHVVLMDELYGGTHALASDQFRKRGLEFTFVGTDADAVIQAATENTTVIVIESPTNPLLSIIDIRKVTGFARQKQIVTLFDNTFASPIHQNPITLGIDVVMHSGTKYIGGHSDITCGAIVASSQHTQIIRNLAQALGGSLNAQTCYLIERSLKTLALRVERQTENAAQIAAFLAGHPAVERVNYPGLKSFTGHELAKSQMSGFGGMLSFELKAINPESFLDHLTLVRPAISLGGVETTICSPALTSHIKISAAERARIGILDSLLRLSVGIEHITDLMEDFEQALSR